MMMKSKYSLRRRNPASVLVAACLGFFLPGMANAVTLGMPAPQFNLNSSLGPASNSAYGGKYLYLDFWASWCGPCKKSFAWMNAMQAHYKDQGLEVLGVNVDENSDDAKAFLKDHPAEFAIAFDPKGLVPREYSIKGMPTSILIGPDGKVLWIHEGFREEQSGLLEQTLAHFLANNSQ